MTDWADPARIPFPDAPFTGTIGETYHDSAEALPQLPSPPDGAPDVVLIMLDDT